MSYAPDLRLHVSVPRLHIYVLQPWISRMSRIQRFLISLFVAVFTYSCGGVLDWLVTRRYLPQTALILGGAMVSMAIGSLILTTLSQLQQRYNLLVDRLQRIAELNHHIRNALQVIVYTNVPERDSEAIRKVKTAVMRIQGVLEEQSAGSRHFTGSFR